MESLGALARALGEEPGAAGSDEALLREAQCAAFERLTATLRSGLGLAPSSSAAPPAPVRDPGRPLHAPPADGAPFLGALAAAFGFVPNVFRAQTLRPSALAAEVRVVERLLLPAQPLSRRRKEGILLAVSAVNSGVYGATLHAEVLATLGVPLEQADQIVLDPHDAGLPEPDATVLDVARGLAACEAPARRLEALLEAGLTRPEALEAVAVAAFGNFLDALAGSLGPSPDFPPRASLLANLSSRENRPMTDEPSRPGPAPCPDPDAELVARIRGGDREAFGDLVLRHERRVYRTALGITGDPADAEDCAQRAFLKAFQALPSFEGVSTFATWLTRIAINESLERVRRRRPSEPFDEEDAGDGGVRPRQVRAWTETPEEIFEKAELRGLVERELLRLPPRYRAAVLLRDLEGLSTQEAAEALGLGIPTLKTHLLRGRLLLREALTPLFAPKGRVARV